MTNVDDLLDRLRDSGVRLAVDGDRLSINSPKGVLTDDLRAELILLKDELKARLRHAPEARSTSGAAPTFQRFSRTAEMPVSHAQRRMWFLKQINPSSTAYHVPSAFRLVGRLDAQALEQSFNDLVMRHESLRMSFLTVDDEPRCRVDAASRVELDQHDLSGLSEEERETAAMRLVVAMARKPFDITRSPLLHAALIRIAADVHVLCFVFDHIVSDGLSFAIFVKELQVLYAARTGGEQARLPDLPFSYPDYVDWQRRSLAAGALERHLAFWKEHLANLPSPLRLPTDRPRSRLRSDNGALLTRMLTPELSAQLKALARREDATLFMVLLAAYQVLLHRYANVTEFTVGTAVANRGQPEIERVFGLFANNIVLRADLSGNPTVHELIARVATSARKAYVHQDMPFDILVEALAPQRDADNPPVFQTMFTLHTLLVINFALGEVECTAIEFQSGTSRFDLAVDVYDLPEGPRICFEYNTDLFNEATIERMMGSFTMLLQGFVADPGVPVLELAMLPAAERHLVIDAFNDTAVATGAESFVAQFHHQVEATPDRVAVGFRGRTLTYRDLDQRASELAHCLVRHGIGRDAIVAVYLQRSPELIVSLIAVQKIGASYLPLDPSFPDDRIIYMLSDSGATALLTSEVLHGLELPLGMVKVDVDAALGGAVPDVSNAPQPTGRPGTAARTVATLAASGDLAYLLYTSGSTGRPKGVAVSHGALSNFLWSMQRTPGLVESDVLAAITTVSFDISGLEIYLPLIVGARIELIPSEVSADGAALAKELASCGATVMQATPATWRLLVEVDWRAGAHFRALCGGEPLSPALADSLVERVGELWNLYGPTETTIWSTCERIDRTGSLITIGRPIANTRVYVLDRHGAPVPIGVPGELWIGGAGVALGYHNRPELTAERFVPDPFASHPGARMYRTGDLGQWLGDGRLQHLGRLDHQVKIRGFRIELGEIETTLGRLPGVRQALVLAQDVAAGDSRLVAYVSYADGNELTSSEVRRALKRALPDYMIPSIVLAVDSLPLTPNGKIDRSALPNPFAERVQDAPADDPPAPGMEQLLADLWRDILKVDRIVASDNFFDLGGHSLLSIRVASAVQRATGWRMDPRTLFFQSLREIASVAPPTPTVAEGSRM